MLFVFKQLQTGIQSSLAICVTRLSIRIHLVELMDVERGQVWQEPSRGTDVDGRSATLAMFPHSHAYYNELAGGYRGGPEHLLDSNIDWGQDCYCWKRWIEQRPGDRLASVTTRCRCGCWIR
ncbi:MAG: hypothetical protein R3C99_24475 [Pirellulaceae bacterium]